MTHVSESELYQKFMYNVESLVFQAAPSIAQPLATFSTENNSNYTREESKQEE